MLCLTACYIHANARCLYPFRSFSCTALKQETLAHAFSVRQCVGDFPAASVPSGLFVGWLVSQWRICQDNCACCHTEIEGADQTFYLTQSQYTDNGPTSPSADPMTPGAWQGSQFWSQCYDSTRENPHRVSANRTSDLPFSRRVLPLLLVEKRFKFTQACCMSAYVHLVHAGVSGTASPDPLKMQAIPFSK